MNFKKRIAPVALAIVLGTATAGTAIASSEIIVDEYIDIPALQEEIVTVQPEADMVWVPGYWERDVDQWNWVAGVWVTPPDEDAVWVNGHWKFDNDKWQWVEGKWVVTNTNWIVTEIVDAPILCTKYGPRSLHHQITGCPDIGIGMVDGVGFPVTGRLSRTQRRSGSQVTGNRTV